MAVKQRLSPHMTNVAAALVFALALTLLGLAWFDMLCYQHFIVSWMNL